MKNPLGRIVSPLARLPSLRSYCRLVFPSTARTEYWEKTRITWSLSTISRHFTTPLRPRCITEMLCISCNVSGLPLKNFPSLLRICTLDGSCSYRSHSFSYSVSISFPEILVFHRYQGEWLSTSSVPSFKKAAKAFSPDRSVVVFFSPCISPDRYETSLAAFHTSFMVEDTPQEVE